MSTHSLMHSHAQYRLWWWIQSNIYSIIHIPIYTLTHTHIYTYTHIHTNNNTHTYTHTLKSGYGTGYKMSVGGSRRPGMHAAYLNDDDGAGEFVCDEKSVSCI